MTRLPAIGIGWPRLPARHRLWQVVADIAIVALAWYLAFLVRFDGQLVPSVPRYDDLLGYTIWIVVLVKTGVLLVSGIYHHWWRYVSIRDIWSLVRAVTVACVIAELVIVLVDPLRGWDVPRGVMVLDWLILLALMTGVRLLTRTAIERPGPRRLVTSGKEALVVGAGDAGGLIVKEMQKSAALGYTPIGLVDDDPRKRNLRLHGVRVLGTTADLPRILEDSGPDEVIIAIPSAAGAARQRIVNACREARVPVKTLPSVNELIAGDLNLARQLREVQVEDVLGREPVELDNIAIASYLEGETVLVTGAGGSIGSELCRQIARLGPARIVLVDHAENNLFEIDRELVNEREFRAVVPVLADAKNRVKMRQVFERYRPTVVFHAAAYKHVPLMEANPLEAASNNVLATRILADLAHDHAAKVFVLVSTDKAAEPTNVLGQSKALCEWVVAAAARRPGTVTRHLAVRFGNVLASSGSVIPLFRRQIQRGGPVTVTHPEMTRYFMTIPEAAQLIIQAGAIGSEGDVFVLDMGEPVRIVDLARNMIRLSGREPDVDVAIEFIGQRPGEKLHEVLWAPSESPEPTSHAKIMRCAAIAVDPGWLDDELGELERVVEDGDGPEVVACLAALIAAKSGAAATAGAPRER